MILKSRLFKPPINKGYIERTRLFDILEANWHKPFHVVVAGAGYGKSILMSHWLDQLKDSYSWITLDKDCNDLRVFLAYLGESIGAQSASCSAELIQLAEAIELPDVNFIRKTLLEILNKIENPHVFVLDDYHKIENPDVHAALSSLVQHFPLRHKLVLLSRLDPQLSFDKMRAFDQVHHLDVKKLNFTTDEIHTLSSQVFSKELEEKDTRQILEITEGWVVPVRLILKAHTEGHKPDKFVFGNSLRGEQLADFLLEEVLNFETEEVKQSLMFASLFDRFSPEMIAEIMSKDDANDKFDQFWFESQLKGFLSRSLFVMPLDEKKKWYRFHELVDYFLQLRADRFITDNRKGSALDIGSRYLESKGIYTEALRLNLNYGRVSQALEIVERHRHTFINFQRFDIIDQWLELFPIETLEQHPGLLMMKIYICHLSNDVEHMIFYLARLEKLLSNSSFPPEISEAYWAEYNSMSTITAFMKGDFERALEIANMALASVSKMRTYVYGFALSFKGIILMNLGREVEARETLKEALNESERSDSILKVQNHLAMCMVEFLSGKLTALADHARLVKRTTKAAYGYSLLVMANYYLAFSNYMRNREAVVHLDESLKYKFTTRPGWIINTYYLKCLYLATQGEESKLSECIEEMENFDKLMINHDHSNDILVFKCELYLLKGDLNSAWRTSLKTSFDQKSLTHRFYCPRLTRIKLYILKGDDHLLEMAEQYILEFEKETFSSIRKINELQLKGLKSLLLYRKGEMKAALDLLRSLLQEAAKEQMIRLFTDLGDEMRKLLQELSDVGYWDEHMERVQASFEEKDELLRLKNQKIRDRELLQVFHNMSTTELEILNLISDGMQNKEISDHLRYSLGTIKTYVYNIYKKIGVKNRTKAILLFKAYKNRSTSMPIDSGLNA